MQVVTAPFWVWSQKTLKWPSKAFDSCAQQGFQLIGQVSPFSSAQVCPFQSQLRDDPPVEKPTATCNHYFISYLTSYMKIYDIYMALAFISFSRWHPHWVVKHRHCRPKVSGLFSLWFCNAFVPGLAETRAVTKSHLGLPQGSLPSGFSQQLSIETLLDTYALTCGVKKAGPIFLKKTSLVREAVKGGCYSSKT